MKKRVDFICHDCAVAIVGKKRPFPDYHAGRCDVCAGLESVTWGRRYGVYEVDSRIMEERRK